MTSPIQFVKSILLNIMNADLEALVLSGKLFSGGERSSSPMRTPSPDAGWHDDELPDEIKALEAKGYDYDADDIRRARRRVEAEAEERQTESIGMGVPGRTGVKGVIRDRNEAMAIEREKRAQEAEEMREKMEKAHLGGKTYLEEEREKAWLGLDGKIDELVLKEIEKAQEIGADERRDVFGRRKEGKFGHLREVGVKGFLSAVEDEEKGVWIVVHLYDPSLERCYTVDNILAPLARLHPDTKFLRARASKLGFTSSRSGMAMPRPQTSRISRSKVMPQHRDDDDDDPYDEKDYEKYKDESEEDEDSDDEDVDLDMLPTILVYRDGELVHNWVRADWVAGPAGLHDLLDRHSILPRSSSRNLGFPVDDGDDADLFLSDEENET